MKYRLNFIFLLVFLNISAICIASEISVKSDKIEKSQDGKTLIYSGNVVLEINGGDQVNISSLNIQSSEAGDVYEGDVKISFDSTTITTNKAAISKSDESIQIKMDLAYSLDKR